MEFLELFWGHFGSESRSVGYIYSKKGNLAEGNSRVSVYPRTDNPMIPSGSAIPTTGVNYVTPSYSMGLRICCQSSKQRP